MQHDPLKQERLTAPETSRVTRIGPPHLADGPPGPAASGHEVARLEAERKRLQARLEELQAELEGRARRQNQLIGVRDQLRLELREREREVARLNREIGALSAAGGAAPARRLWASVWRAVGGVRMPAGLPRPGARPSHAEAVPAAEPALVPWGKEGRPRPVLCVVLSALPHERAGATLDLIERQAAGRGMVPLVLTDDDDFLPFRGRRVIAEYLPSKAKLEAAAPGRPAELYLQRRLALLRRKWQPARIVALGPAAVATVQLWQESPFEATPVPAFTAGRGLEPGP